MARFGGNEFTGFSIPLIFAGRYFLMEPGKEVLISVFTEQKGEAVFEVLKNNPVQNPYTEVNSNATRIVTVADKQSGKFLYKVRPGSETSVTFGKLDGGEISARITDQQIEVGGTVLQNNTFVGSMVGVVVNQDGRIGIGASIPPLVRRLLTSQ